MQKTALYLAIALAGGILIWMLFLWQPETGEGDGGSGPFISPQPAGGDFSLVSNQGPVSLSDYLGKVVLLYFGYTWCPDICPTNLTMMASALSEMDAAERLQIQPLFVSVDPDRDTPQRLQEYVEYFHSSLIGLTGSKPEIDEVVGRYGAAYRIVDKKRDAPYVVDHTADTYIIDKQGRLVRKIYHGASSEELLGALRPLLQENLSR
ncbi:MAG: SCO family protein [Candidatus Thiodiazotropha sp.]